MSEPVNPEKMKKEEEPVNPKNMKKEEEPDEKQKPNLIYIYSNLVKKSPELKVKIDEQC